MHAKESFIYQNILPRVLAMISHDYTRLHMNLFPLRALQAKQLLGFNLDELIRPIDEATFKEAVAFGADGSGQYSVAYLMWDLTRRLPDHVRLRETTAGVPQLYTLLVRTHPELLSTTDADLVAKYLKYDPSGHKLRPTTTLLGDGRLDPATAAEYGKLASPKAPPRGGGTGGIGDAPHFAQAQAERVQRREQEARADQAHASRRVEANTHPTQGQTVAGQVTHPVASHLAGAAGVATHPAAHHTAEHHAVDAAEPGMAARDVVILAHLVKDMFSMLSVNEAADLIELAMSRLQHARAPITTDSVVNEIVELQDKARPAANLPASGIDLASVIDVDALSPENSLENSPMLRGDGSYEGKRKEPMRLHTSPAPVMPAVPLSPAAAEKVQHCWAAAAKRAHAAELHAVKSMAEDARARGDAAKAAAQCPLHGWRKVIPGDPLLDDDQVYADDSGDEAAERAALREDEQVRLHGPGLVGDTPRSAGFNSGGFGGVAPPPRPSAMPLHANYLPAQDYERKVERHPFSSAPQPPPPPSSSRRAPQPSTLPTYSRTSQPERQPKPPLLPTSSGAPPPPLVALPPRSVLPPPRLVAPPPRSVSPPPRLVVAPPSIRQRVLLMTGGARQPQMHRRHRHEMRSSRWPCG